MATFRLSNGPVSLEITDDSCETVQDVLNLYREQFNIPANATASVDGRTADLNTPIEDGAEVAFDKPTGSKG